MSVTPYERCRDCGKVVKVNKPGLGSLHLCVPTPEKDAELRRRARRRRG